MANELQELKDLIQQLGDENRQLQERNAADSSPTDFDPLSPVDFEPNVIPPERLLYIPRERKCPLFRGTAGIPVEDWTEEMRAT